MPRLALIATGGTIAGSGSPEHYTAASLAPDSLLGAAGRLRQLADWQIEQSFALDSRDLCPEHWLLLAACIQKQLADPEIAGVLLTHGTDSLEESAFALDLLLPTGKPVVLTAAMRPATSLSSDGPLNLLQAACVALSPQAWNQGVLVMANDAVIAGRDLIKSHTHAPGALRPQAGCAALGAVLGETVQLKTRSAPARPALLQARNEENLPRVDILYAHTGAQPDLIDACCTAGAKGLVLALAGHGSIPQAWREALARAIDQGVHVVRASRIEAGGVWPECNEQDELSGCVAARGLSPLKARILLLLALAENPALDRPALDALFAQF